MKSIARCNVSHLSVGIVAGDAFAAIVQNLVKDIANLFSRIVKDNLDVCNHFWHYMARYSKHLRMRTKLGARNRGGRLITAIQFYDNRFVGLFNYKDSQQN